MLNVRSRGQKHFTAERPSKFFNRIIDNDYKYTSDEHSLIEKIAAQHLINNF